MGATLAEYELISLISETGLSKVYHSKINHKDVAIKIAKPGCENPLINNFAVQSKLNHPNIIKVYMRDFDEETSSNFTVMEYFPFPRLSDYVEKNAVSFGRSLKILSSLFDAIKYSHSKDVTHGDIHPKNILISPLEIKVTDFNYNPYLDPAFVADSLDLESIPKHFVHPGWQAPEQDPDYGEIKASKEADVYALALVARKIWTGKNPSPHMNMPSKESGLLPATDKLFDRALDENPEKRADIAELCGILNNIESSYNSHVGRASSEDCGKFKINALDIADRLFEEGEVSKAEEMYEAAATLYPKNPEALEKLFRIYMLRGKLDNAFEILESKKQNFDKNVWDFLLNSAVEAGKISRNRKALRYLLHETPMEHEAPPEWKSFYNQALDCFSSGDYGKAIENAAEALRLNSKNNKSRAIIHASLSKVPVVRMFSGLPRIKNFNELLEIELFAEQLSKKVLPEYYAKA